jgi:hypothetical protein
MKTTGKIWFFISHNVPAVYDVNGGIKGLAEQDRRRLCAGMRRGSL